MLMLIPPMKWWFAGGNNWKWLLMVLGSHCVVALRQPEGSRSSNTESERDSERQPERRCAQGESPHLSAWSSFNDATPTSRIFPTPALSVCKWPSYSFLIFTPPFRSLFYSLELIFVQPVAVGSNRWSRTRESTISRGFKSIAPEKASFAS